MDEAALARRESEKEERERIERGNLMELGITRDIDAAADAALSLPGRGIEFKTVTAAAQEIMLDSLRNPFSKNAKEVYKQKIKGEASKKNTSSSSSSLLSMLDVANERNKRKKPGKR